MRQEDKYIHEFRDPIHVFIKMNSMEREVVDSIPLQRLRHIHQLGLSSLIYPGASHKRFEHSLGVMELATRIFNTITDINNLTDQQYKYLPMLRSRIDLGMDLRHLRMAALCHDIGHLPFSHAAEKDLLPDGWDHERFTEDLILSEEMSRFWKLMNLNGERIAKIAVGPANSNLDALSPWDTILSEIITGDMFGADRMDYLLRDSLHIGVAYGGFDHYRLIDTLRILIEPETETPALGIQEGGKHSVEALVLARYFMFTQVYLHPIRLIYDKHLKDFLKEWLENGLFSTCVDDHIKLTDNEVFSGLRRASADDKEKGHKPASIICNRRHFKIVVEREQQMVKEVPDMVRSLENDLIKQLGEENVKYVKASGKATDLDFLIERNNGSVVSSKLSQVIDKLPPIVAEYIYVSRDKVSEAREWLKQHSDLTVKPKEEK